MSFIRDRKYLGSRDCTLYVVHRLSLHISPAMQATIGDKIVETFYFNRVTSENKRICPPPLSPAFKVGVFVVFYR